MLREGRVPHALLLSGKEGGGAFMEAFYTVLCLMCPQSGKAGEPCYQCKNCHRIQQWLHPDVYLMMPAFESKPDIGELMKQWRNFTADRDFFTVSQWGEFLGTDKKPNIYGDQVRNMMQRYQLKSYEGGKKLFILWAPEYLEKQSNRILKILEEPTSDTYFILVTYDKNALLPTILSRTQQFNIPDATDEALEAYALEQNLGEPARVREVVHLADGNVAEMTEMLRKDKQVYSDILLEALRAAYARDGLKMAGWTEEASRMSHREYFYFIRYQLHFLREALAGFAVGDYQKRLLSKEQNAAEWLLSKVREQDLLPLAAKMDKLSVALNQHANTKILSMKIIQEYRRLFYNQ